jgi:hypothetical protein
MIATAQEIIDDALVELGILSAPGQAASPGNTAIGLSKLNQMIDQWNLRQARIWAVERRVYSFIPAQATYTLGPTGDWIGTRPIGPRPGNGIYQASAILPGSPSVNIPITILDQEQWANLRLRNIGATIPLALYNDGAVPNTNVYFYGTPPAGYQIELWTQRQLSQYAAANTSLTLPPGYRLALSLSLAEELIGIFSRIIPAIPVGLDKRAKDARAALVALRVQPAPQTNDAGTIGASNRPAYNWRTGGFV